MNVKQDESGSNPRMVALWRLLMDMERTWRGFSPLPDLNKSLFGVMMCVAHGGKPASVAHGLKGEHGAQASTESAQCAPGTQASATAKPVAVGAIATQMQQSLPAISQKISTLEEMGYVTRVSDADDRRVTCVVLTQIGAQKLREGRAQFEAKLNAALDVLGEAHMQQLLALLQELNEALKQTVIAPQPKEHKPTKGE